MKIAGEFRKKDDTASVIHTYMDPLGQLTYRYVVRDEPVEELLSKLIERLHREEVAKIFVLAN